MSIRFENEQLSIISNSGAITPVSQIIEKFQKPTYVYDLDEISNRLDHLAKCFGGNTSVHYAMKANSHPAILKLVAAKNLGVDVVSVGEIELSVAAGIRPENIVFSGVGKTVKEIDRAIELKIKQINVESPSELRRICGRAKALGKKAYVAFRMNPDVDPDTHPYIKTGFRDNKFGMDESFMPDLESILRENAEHVELKGLTLHIGSQIQDLTSFLDAIRKTLPLYDYLKEQGHPLSNFDIGGGVGISYTEDNGHVDYEKLDEYGKATSELIGERGLQLLIEPGRVVVGRSGLLLTQIQYIKKSPFKKFAIVDTGMHHLMRPSLYKAFHRIVPVTEHKNRSTELYDVVGPICESSDVVGYDRSLPQLEEGEWLAVCDAGAYGFAMANTYNAHELPQECVVSKGKILES